MPIEADWALMIQDRPRVQSIISTHAKLTGTFLESPACLHACERKCKQSVRGLETMFVDHLQDAACLCLRKCRIVYLDVAAVAMKARTRPASERDMEGVDCVLRAEFSREGSVQQLLNVRDILQEFRCVDRTAEEGPRDIAKTIFAMWAAIDHYVSLTKMHMKLAWDFNKKRTGRIGPAVSKDKWSGVCEWSEIVGAWLGGWVSSMD